MLHTRSLKFLQEPPLNKEYSLKLEKKGRDSTKINQVEEDFNSTRITNANVP